MLLRLSQVACLPLICLLLHVRYNTCKAEPCLDLYKDVHRPRVYNIDDIEEVSPIHGLAHKTISGMHHHGMRQLEIWMQTLVPGTAIPPHTHGGEEVVIALKGTATFNSRDPDKQVQVQTLRSNDTVVILPGVVHSFSNVGDEDVQLMIALTGDIHPMVYPRWGADASDAQRMEPLAFDTRCPSKLQERLDCCSGNARIALSMIVIVWHPDPMADSQSKVQLPESLRTVDGQKQGKEEL